MTQASYLIVSTMRDEGPFILEWLAHHRAIGFTDFLIYTNDCRDGTDLLLDRLEQHGIVTHVRNNVLRRGPHKSALKYAQDHPLYSNADWVYVCDADEFLNIQVGGGVVTDLIERFPKAEVIPVAWRHFSNNGLETLGEGLLLEQLIACEPETPDPVEPGRFVKSLFRPSKMVQRMGLHAPVFEDDGDARWGAVWLEADSEADPRRPSKDFGYEVAQVNHYAVRSIDAFLIKRDRGRANHVGEDLGFAYWKRWCRDGAEDNTILRHLPAIRAEIARLMEDPVTAALHRGATEFHRKRLTELLRDDSYRGLRADIVEHYAQVEPSAEIPPQAGTAAALQLKAPKRHQNRLRMLERMPKGGRCAEIGVWNGAFSEAILDTTRPRELVLIDPWDLLAAEGEEAWTHKKHSQRDEMLAMYENVVSRYGGMAEVTIRKGFSSDILAEYPDGYFDWVYIDGNHLYDAVRKDLELSFRKVRPGGLVAGDDFFWKRGGRMHVREAVFDVLRALGVDGPPDRIGQQYMIRVAEIPEQARRASS